MNKASNTMRKRQLKRTLCAAMSCLLLLALLPVSALAAGHWANSYVQTARDYGWLQEGNVAADSTLTRAEFAVILWRALSCPDAQADCPFTDVSGDMEKAATAALSEAGIVTGASATSFNPNGNLTRAEALVMLAHAYSLTAENQNAAAGFSDWPDVGSWAQDAMAAMVEQGFVDGMGGNRLAPDREITLGEMCKLIIVIADASAPSTRISADDAIAGINTIGYVDAEGAKISAIVVEYNVDLTGAALGTGVYDVMDYGIQQGDDRCDLGSDPGKPLKAYVNNEAAVSETGGAGTGKYVIIEVNTDYQLGTNLKTFKLAMAASVLQTGTIQTAGALITPGTKEVVNYTTTAVRTLNPQTGQWRDPEYYDYVNEDAFTLSDFDKFDIHTLDGTGDLAPFQATRCFDEATGEYYDFDVPYAIYVPDDYEDQAAEGKEFALVLHIADAGCLGDDPRISLGNSQGPANFASDEVQQIVKDQGLGGLIVLVPQFSEDYDMDGDGEGEFNLRSTRDNWSLSCAVPATWQLLDTITDTYAIDTDRIYATGQSMGGMQVIAMAAQRDNYFAGVWENGCQWGSNYNLEYKYQDAEYYAAPADGDLIWTVDADGSACDYRNWYYMISDDNVLITNCIGDSFSTKIWQELAFLYHDLAGVDVEKTIFNPLTASETEQNATIRELVSRSYDTDFGFYWYAMEGGNHGATWIYSHNLIANYEWLLTQTRESEMTRDKLDLDKPFEFAEEQLMVEERYIGDSNADGSAVYYATGKEGAGTKGYNSVLLGMNGNGVERAPGWTAEK